MCKAQQKNIQIKVSCILVFLQKKRKKRRADSGNYADTCLCFVYVYVQKI